MNETDLFAEVLDRIDSFLAGAGDMRSTAAQAEAFLADGEAVLSAWLVAKGQQPTDETVEGFRLLALHRQGARGDPSFNACRETCREIIYLRNVITLYDDDTAECRHQLRLQAMVLRHLALFVGGKLVEAGLGDFCCSAKAVRSAAPADAFSGAKAARQ